MAGAEPVLQEGPAALNLDALHPAFRYRNGVLHVENVPVTRIADAAGTPCYIYSTEAIRSNYRAYRDALANVNVGICYAVKANSNQAVIATLAEEGAGADVVSVGEMKRALAAGIPAHRIVFSGVGKTEDELKAAISAGIHQINVESESELDLVSAVAESLGSQAPVALRVNPDVDAKTHAKISTGLRENKFGIDIARAMDVWRHAALLPGVDLKGLAVHIGSQLLDLSPFRNAYERLAACVIELRRAGFSVQRLDLGGGIGVQYAAQRPASLDEYAAIVQETLGDLDCGLTIEPGRSLVANAGILLSRVIRVKNGSDRRFLIVDAAMNDLVRPAMYDAWHEILPARVEGNPVDLPLSPVDVVGPICETGDTFARQRSLPPLGEGDLMLFCSAGAYGAVMASSYNSRPPAAEVLVREGEFAIVRPRQSVEDLIRAEPLPSWIGQSAG